MNLSQVLDENRDAILRKWYDRIIKSYPRPTSRFMANSQDQFSNPVGHAIREGIGPIITQLGTDMDQGSLLAALDQIIRIRSVQEFSAAGAVAFVFDLKPVIRETLNGYIPKAELSVNLAEIDSRIDQVALLAFEKYTECREQLSKVRISELQSSLKLRSARAERKRADAQLEGEIVMKAIDGQGAKGGEGN